MGPVGGRYRAFLHRYFLPQWPSALGLLALVIAATAVQLVQPDLLARFIDTARAGAPPPALVRIAVLFLLLAAVAQGVGIGQAYLSERVGLTATNRVRADLLLHCLRLDPAFHHAHRPGELIQRIDGDVESLGNFFSRFLVTLLANGMLLLGVLIVVATIAPWLGGVLALFSGAMLAVLFRMRSIGSPYWQRSMQAQAEQAGFLEEHLSATEDIRSSGAVAFALRGFFVHARDVLRHRLWAVGVGDVVGGGGGRFLFTVGTAAALAVAAWLFGRGAVSIGTVFLIFTYTQMLSAPIQVIHRQIQDLQTATAAMERVHQLLETRSRIVDGPGADLPAGPLSIEIAAVHFDYGSGTPVLRNVSVRVAPGRVLGVLGRTGSGKTTLARLLLRLYDPQAGVVRIGGVDVRTLQRAALRRRIALVTQEVQIFHASVRDNVTLFAPGVADARIVAVLRELGLGRWLDGLPDGLDTLIASGGIGLSAGEAQLLAFARAFLRDPDLVILDEATSRLDPATEERLEAAVTRLLRGRTALVIAHRLRTVVRADEILIVGDGGVMEYGARIALESDPASRFSQLLAVGLEEASG